MHGTKHGYKKVLDKYNNKLEGLFFVDFTMFHFEVVVYDVNNIVMRGYCGQFTLIMCFTW